MVPLWRGVDRFHPTIKNDFTVQGEGIFLGVIPEEADKHKKAKQPKLITKLTSNQTKKNICSSFNDELLLELPVPLVAPGATAFLTLFVFPFLFLFFFFFSLFRSPQIIPPPPPSLASTALWLQVAHPRVELTALQCTKRAS